VPQFDEELVEAIRSNFFNAPEAGRVEVLVQAMPGAILVPQIFGTKIPLLSGYMDFRAREMDDPRYLAKLNKSNIGLLCGPPSADICTVDVDTDAGLPEFLEVNPWARGAQFSHSRRGGNFYFRPAGDYTAEVIRLLKGESPWGEVRLGRCLTTISGYHPCGTPYVIENLGAIPEIALEDINLPEGVEVACRKNSKRNGVATKTDGVCHLDLELLEQEYGLHQAGEKLIGRCPACAERGQDRRGEHLVIYASGAYSCIVCADTQRIYEIVGRKKRG
jgi:hypothetical protein